MKKLIQTRWAITPEAIVIQPYGAYYMVFTLFSVVFAIWLWLFTNALKISLLQTLSILWPVAAIFLLAILFFGLFARTKIVFDKYNRIMYQLTFGFWKITALPFADVLSIMRMPAARGTSRYYALHKNAKWWNAGTVISSAVPNDHSLHARALQAELLPAIQQCLHQHKGASATRHLRK